MAKSNHNKKEAAAQTLSALESAFNTSATYYLQQTEEGYELILDFRDVDAPQIAACSAQLGAALPNALFIPREENGIPEIIVRGNALDDYAWLKHTYKKAAIPQEQDLYFWGIDESIQNRINALEATPKPQPIPPVPHTQKILEERRPKKEKKKPTTTFSIEERISTPFTPNTNLATLLRGLETASDAPDSAQKRISNLKTLRDSLAALSPKYLKYSAENLTRVMDEYAPEMSAEDYRGIAQDMLAQAVPTLDIRVKAETRGGYSIQLKKPQNGNDWHKKTQAISQVIGILLNRDQRTTPPFHYNIMKLDVPEQSTAHSVLEQLSAESGRAV